MEIPEIERSSVSCKTWLPKSTVLNKAVYFQSVLSYDEMFRDILMKNQLCIIGPSATETWCSRQLWVKQDGTPNFDYIKENFGNATAPVADCCKNEFNSHCKLEMTVKDFVEYWQRYSTVSKSEKERCLYLKDWHFTRDFPHYKAYTPPDLFCSDWLNEFWGSSQMPLADDYKFVYMGPRGSWTPFHADVLHSYSWSANICGRKKWIFYPPGSEDYLQDRHGQLIFDLSSLESSESSLFPDSSRATPITVIQEQGEIIFVPSGWHHQVFNLEDTISINHNWTNGCGAHLCWEFLKSRLKAVQKEISDCRDMDGWHEHCQLILKSDSGIDYAGFFSFMANIAQHRMDALRHYQTQEYSFQQRSYLCLNKSHCKDTTQNDGQVPSCYNTKISVNTCGNTTKRENCDFKIDRDNQTEVSTDGINNDHNFVSEICENTNNFKADDTDEDCLSCPHWSHCGVNLALFDLKRIKHIIEDLVIQPHIFIDIEKNNFIPTDLILEIEHLEKEFL